MRLAGAASRRFATGEIAVAINLSRNHLAKTVRNLARAGFKRTRGGIGGGFPMAVGPRTTTPGDVVRFLEERHALAECFRGDRGACRLAPPCRLNPRLAAEREAFLEELGGTRLGPCAYP